MTLLEFPWSRGRAALPISTPDQTSPMTSVGLPRCGRIPGLVVGLLLPQQVAYSTATTPFYRQTGRQAMGLGVKNKPRGNISPPRRPLRPVKGDLPPRSSLPRPPDSDGRRRQARSEPRSSEVHTRWPGPRPLCQPRTDRPGEPYDAPAWRDSGSFSVVSDSSSSRPTTVTGASLARSSLILSASPTTTMAM